MSEVEHYSLNVKCPHNGPSTTTGLKMLVGPSCWDCWGHLVGCFGSGALQGEVVSWGSEPSTISSVYLLTIASRQEQTPHHAPTPHGELHPQS